MSRGLLWFAGFVLALAPAIVLAEDWPHLRGARYDGSTFGAAALAAPTLRLELAWRKPLGSGFSVPIVVGDRVVTTFSDGSDDLVAAFSLATGEELWRTPLAPTYRGHDGSPDGPHAAPTSDGERLFVLAPRGELLAVTLERGAVLWRRHLVDDFGGEPPFYGYAISPLVVDETVVVQGGGPGQALVALDRESGEARWASGDLLTDYGSPVLATLGGRLQIAAVGRQQVAGFDPATGRELWRYAYREGGESNSFLVPLPGSRLLIRGLPDSLALQLEHTDAGELEVRELWRKPVFKAETAVPVAHDGVLYGFDGRFLSAVDVETGERRWKSRPPGGAGLALAGSDLVVLAEDGAAVVAAADAGGYRERARVSALETTGSSWPVVAGEWIAMRDLQTLAVVRMVAGAPGPAPEATATAEAPGEVTARAESGTETATSEFQRQLERAASSPSAAFALDRLLAATRPPVVEPTSQGALVTFVWRGEARDVGLAGTFLEDHEEIALARLPGSDVFFRTLALDTPALHEYWLRVDFEDGSRPDPSNPARGPSAWFWSPSDVSLLELGADLEPELALYDGDRRGRIETFELEALGREVDVYIPAELSRDRPAAGSERSRLPLFLAFDRRWLGRGGGLANALDHTFERDRCAPAIAAAVDLGFADSHPAAVTALVDAVIDELENRYPIDPERIRIVGSLGGALVAVVAALERPRAIEGVALFSAVDLTFLGGLIDAIEEAGSLPAATRKPRAFVHYTEHGGRSRELRWDQPAYNRRLIERLGALGFDVVVDHPRGSLGWSTWRRQAPRALDALCAAER